MRDGPQLDRRSLGLALGAGAVVAATWRAARALRWSLIEPRSHADRSVLLAAYARQAEPEDVLLVGSSRVQGGIDATLVQRNLDQCLPSRARFYKLGLAGLRPPLLEQVLAELVLPRPPRRLLVLALDERFFSVPVDTAESPAGGGADQPAAEGEWRDDLLSGVWSPFRGPRALWTLDWALDPEVRDLVRFVRAQGGEIRELQARLQRDRHKRKLLAVTNDPFDLPEGTVWGWSGRGSADVTAFRRSLALLDGLACDVLWVRMPIQPEFAAEELAEPLARLQREILPLIAERGLDYIDLNGAPWPVRDVDYLGKTHLSRSGCVATSERFARDVLAPRLAGTTGAKAPRE
jgi:hypothetical protein